MAENKAYQIQNKELLFAFRFLSEAIDARDPYTLGHMNRVARYSMKILDQLPEKEDSFPKTCSPFSGSVMGRGLITATPAMGVGPSIDGSVKDSSHEKPNFSFGTNAIFWPPRLSPISKLYPVPTIISSTS